jgi:hypothetical protein
VARIEVPISNRNDIEAEDVSGKSLYFTLAYLKSAKKYNRESVALFFCCIYSEPGHRCFLAVFTARVTCRSWVQEM